MISPPSVDLKKKKKIVINIQNATIFEPVILMGFYTSKKINCYVVLFGTNYLTEFWIP